jgi:hypothetical protein
MEYLSRMVFISIGQIIETKMRTPGIWGGKTVELDNIDLHKPDITLYFYLQSFDDALKENPSAIQAFYDSPLKIEPAPITFDDSVIYPVLTGEIAERRPII